ncbi:MAG TPA: helix-turn-helix transcriptional regulator [Draconibacterium sp.]|nr:helix-turn-helix transcriptional regulator [Draconibacterium sp.]
MIFRRLLYILVVSLISCSVSAIQIKGKIELSERWQPKVFLALLNSPEDLFVASPDFIIAETFINPDGSFELKTETVPVNSMFYRLYLVRGNNSSVEFSATQNKNYIHLLLKRDDRIEINARTENNALNIVEINGCEACETILDFDKKYFAQTGVLTGQLPKAKSNFLSQELENFIHSFVADAKDPYTGLYALYHIDDKETDFLRNRDFYFDFQKRLEDEIPTVVYTEVYNDLLDELIGFREFVCQMPEVQPRWKDWVIIIEGGFIVVLLLVIFVLSRKIDKLRKAGGDVSDKLKTQYNALTLKQQEILGLLASGKSNKEIAQDLFIELSTVKTHINNIYRQLGVSTRKEAVDIYKLVNR